MQKVSAFVTLFVLTSGSFAYGCGGNDSATPTHDEMADAGVAAPDGAPGAPATDGGAPVVPDPDGGPSIDDGDAGATASAQIIAYVFSNKPDTAESTPSATYSYNASGGAMKVKRTDIGRYDVTFSGLAADSGVAIASAYDAPGGLCHWGKTAGEVVTVRCFDASGSYADTKFILTVFGKGTKGATILGFAHANDKTSASYTPQASRSNNAVGAGLITATRTAVGTYEMEFDGLSLTDIGNVQVTPYGSPSAHCVVKFWSGPTVKVNCYDNAGAAADAQYTLLIAGTKPGGTARVVGYAKANEAASATYSPALTFNAGNGTVTALRNAAGTYTAIFDGLNLNNGTHVQVSAHNGGHRCNVHAWAGTTINLTCASVAGNLVDNEYAMVVVQ